MEEALLSLDLGTTFCKASLHSPAGALLDEARHPLQTQLPAPGWAEQDPDEWWKACVSTIRTVTARNAVAIRSVGLSGRMGTIVYLDKESRPVAPAILYADSRGAPHREQILNLGLAETLGLGVINTLPRMMWMQTRRPETVRLASHVCGAKDAVGLWLTGEYATDYSNGPMGLEWPEAVADLAGVAPGSLPPVMHPTASLGSVSPSAAEQTGIEAGTSVVIGASDGACANLGVGAYWGGMACLSLSTTGVVRLVSDSPPPVPALAALGGFGYRVDTGIWLWGGVVTAAGAALDWLNGVFGGLDMTVDRLADEAASAPVGSDGVLFRPYLQGMHSPEYRPGERGAFIGLAMTHGRPHLARAVMEGVAYSVRAVVEALEVHGAPVHSWYLTGGSARSDLWRRILADVLGSELCLREGGTSLGAAILAACGSSVYPTIQSAADAMVSGGETIVPSSAAQEYADVYAAFRRAVGLGGGSAGAARA